MIYTGPELKKAHAWDAGYDLISTVDIEIPPGGMAFISTETRVILLSKEVGLVCPRSGLGKKGIGIVNAPGVIDAGYTGRIGVTLINHAETPYRVEVGDKIAQLVVVELGALTASRVDPEVFEKAAGGYDRGEKGFGSSGR